MRTKWLLAGLAVLTLLAACAQVELPEPAATPGGEIDGSESPPPAAQPTQADSTAPLPESSRAPESVPSPTAAAEMGEAPADLIQRAIADLVLRTGATDANIKVVSAMAVTWNDGSLGCPTPGEVYLQVLVEGYQIQLSYQGNTYDYHASAKAVFLCENGLQMQAGSPENLSPTLRLVTLAMQDLALRLSISTSQIVAQPVIPTVWPDTSLGCPEAGQAYAAVETPGYQIRLDAGGMVYTYHSDLERVVFCTSP